jgi:hypothetical protein
MKELEIKLPESICTIVATIAHQYKEARETKTEYIALAMLEGVKMVGVTIDSNAAADIEQLFRSELK